MSWTKIEEVTLSSSQASVTLGSGGTLPQTFKTLKLICSIRGNSTGSGQGVLVTFNGTTTTYSDRYLRGNGSTASSGTETKGYVGEADQNGATANTFGNLEVTIPNYTSATANKAYSADHVSENNATGAYQHLTANLWSSTNAITSIVVTAWTGENLVSGTTIYLYGLK